MRPLLLFLAIVASPSLLLAQDGGFGAPGPLTTTVVESAHCSRCAPVPQQVALPRAVPRQVAAPVVSQPARRPVRFLRWFR